MLDLPNFYPNETTYNANEGEATMWKDDTMQIIKPKGRGAGVMVSDFVEERAGYLALSSSMYQSITDHDPAFPCTICQGT